MYGWQNNNEKDFQLVLQQQSAFTQNHFENRCNQIIVQFAEQVITLRNDKYVEIYVFEGFECGTLL